MNVKPPDNLPSYTDSQSSSSASPPFTTKFASLSLHKDDRIRLLQFPKDEVTAIRDVIKKSWPGGVQSERPYSMSYEYKCYGNPWKGQGGDAIPARILMRGIFAYLYQAGWILTASTDISKKQHDKDTLIFRHQSPPPPPSLWIAISFNQGDRLRLIGAPASLIACFTVLLKSLKLLQGEFWKDKPRNAYEFKLCGYPWKPSGEETMSTRLLVLKIIELLERQGWSLYGSVDQNSGVGSGDDYGGETDSWYCVRARDWVPGQAIFHR